MARNKFGRVEFETKGFKIVPILNTGKPSGKYGIIAGKYLVSEPMSLKQAKDKLMSDDFKPGKKKKTV